VSSPSSRMRCGLLALVFLLLTAAAGASHTDCLLSSCCGPSCSQIVTRCTGAYAGDAAPLACSPGGAIVAIDFASYGRPQGMCGEFRIGTCHAASSQSVVETSCLGLSACDVSASSSVFGNPCSNPRNHLLITYTCLEPLLCRGGNACGVDDDCASGACAGGSCETPVNTTACGTASEYDRMTLACPTGTMIGAIDFASYGTPAGGCGSFAIGTCHAMKSVEVVESFCLGHTSCTIPVVNGVFGDPCFMTRKDLYVEATCTDAWPDDADLDGVPDVDDRCRHTPAGAVVDDDGCSIGDLCPCEEAWSSHGEYVRCVAAAAAEFHDADRIGRDEKGAIVSAAARCDCGKPTQPRGCARRSESDPTPAKRSRK